ARALHRGTEARAPRPRPTAGLETVVQAALILSVTCTAASLVATLVGHASERRALGLQVTGLAQTVARVTIYIVGALVLLSVLGIHVTPILTALGVGGLAVALALQDSLSNLFAGLHLLADKPIRVGDYVKIADALEGYGTDSRAPRRARAVHPLHPRLRRVVARFHADLPGRVVRRSVSRPARAAKAHPAPPPRGGDRDPVSGADGGAAGRATRRLAR